MSWLAAMTWYQQAATAFFLGFLPFACTALIIAASVQERKLMQSYPAEPPVRKGIPVRPNREPAVPTIVFAQTYKMYCDWCYSCRVNPNSRDMKFAGVCEPSPFRTYGNDHGFGPAPDYALKWKQVAFLCVNPEEYYNTWSNNAWSDLERMRRNNQFTRAFYYPDIWNIRPDVTDEGRSWD